jgi:hypothetical protein
MAIQWLWTWMVLLVDKLWRIEFDGLCHNLEDI